MYLNPSVEHLTEIHNESCYYINMDIEFSNTDKLPISGITYRGGQGKWSEKFLWDPNGIGCE